MAYAQGTEVPIEKSKLEIEAVVRRYGADGYLSGWEADRAMVQFHASGRYVRFLVDTPKRDERRFTHHRRGMRTADAAILMPDGSTVYESARDAVAIAYDKGEMRPLLLPSRTT